MENNLFFASIIVVSRNEEKFIGKCLDSLLEQDYPKNKMEILVVDGMSEDRTREIVQNYSRKFPFVKVLNNPDKFTPFAFNVGIKNSIGDIVAFMGAHADYDKNYISKCSSHIKEYGADCVGGVLKVIPSDDKLESKAIAKTIASFFGAGNAHYKASKVDGPRLVDTVFGACYKKEVFSRIGFFDEKLIRNQDLEFNLRLKKAGGKIMLFPDMESRYYPKPNFLGFFRHNFSDGFWVVYPLIFGIKAFSWRHLLPLFLVAGLIVTGALAILFPSLRLLFLLVVVSYFFIAIYFSVRIALESKDLRLAFYMPIAFLCRHIGYGLGSLRGMSKVALNKISHFSIKEGYSNIIK